MTRNITLAALVALALAGSAWAQERTQPARGVAPQGQQQIDTHVANCLIIGNHEEIALCRFALERAHSEDVKELAQKMIDDHQQFVTKLRKYGTQGVSFELRADSREPGVKTAAGTKEPSTVTQVEGTAPARTASTDPNWAANKVFQMERDAAQECLNLTQECLGKYKGTDFDQAFLGQQVGMHIGMRAKLTAAEDDVSPEFQQLLRDGLKTAKEHQQHAEKLMEQVGRKDAARSSKTE